MPKLLLFALIGFAAQMVDGSLGMAYGVTATLALVSTGITPLAASAAVHAAEVFTTGASGLAHGLLRNIDRKLFFRLVVPGIIGGVAGALLLANIPTDIARILVPAYLALMGLRILTRIRAHPAPDAHDKPVVPLALAGGFLDASGGGGWGPIVASTLMARGVIPRHAIGTVNATEFFVSLAITVTFFSSIGLQFTVITLGLMLGGLVAAPIAALAVRHVPRGLALGLVGVTVLLLSGWNLFIAVRALA